MLILSRREQQRVRLGEHIMVTVVEVSGDRVRLGFDAPPNILVLRDELTRPDTATAGVAVSRSLESNAAGADLKADC